VTRLQPGANGALESHTDPAKELAAAEHFRLA
jgi:hypothetical protein